MSYYCATLQNVPRSSFHCRVLLILAFGLFVFLSSSNVTVIWQNRTPAGYDPPANNNNNNNTINTNTAAAIEKKVREEDVLVLGYLTHYGSNVRDRVGLCNFLRTALIQNFTTFKFIGFGASPKSVPNGKLKATLLSKYPVDELFKKPHQPDADTLCRCVRLVLHEAQINGHTTLLLRTVVEQDGSCADPRRPR
eukprot:PhM_4_TR18818/c2_g5_i1/m.35815